MFASRMLLAALRMYRWGSEQAGIKKGMPKA
jgi:hypothetical protein